MTLRFIGLMLASFWVASTAHAKAPKIGLLAPTFIITQADKSKLASSELLGKVVVINIWATWCGPCKAEMPMMDSYHRRNKARGLEIFGVMTADSYTGPALKDLVKAMSYPVAVKLKGPYAAMGGAVPTSYVIDRQGVIRYAKAGSFTYQEFRAILEPLLADGG
jgi:cytochrome c biogenesis protein CcmG, thiol:disulfide interchange protein DsbE